MLECSWISWRLELKYIRIIRINESVKLHLDTFKYIWTRSNTFGHVQILLKDFRIHLKTFTKCIYCIRSISGQYEFRITIVYFKNLTRPRLISFDLLVFMKSKFSYICSCAQTVSKLWFGQAIMISNEFELFG